MAYSLDDKLVIGVSGRALFDLELENEIFINKGLEAYKEYQINHENDTLKPGSGFHLVKALLSLNKQFDEEIVEVIVMSQNSPETGLRIFNSIDKEGLPIIRAAFTGGEDISKYLTAFKVDLFLSKSKQDVQEAVDLGVAAGLIYSNPKDFDGNDKEVRIAFDGDAVIFSDDSEKIYKKDGLEAFQAHEQLNVQKPIPEGPFGKLLKTLSKIKERETDEKYIRIALVTARSSPSHKRVILTLRSWGVEVDEAFFLGGVSKEQVLKSFNAHIFFDDQDTHVKPASNHIPSAKVPYRSDSELNKNNGNIGE